ncbi:MAG: glycoside hydrolase family 32 protein [Clostridiales bacterium]|nr:glycoside hydrolase family 32 protein [Clostridiales bacterium]
MQEIKVERKYLILPIGLEARSKKLCFYRQGAPDLELTLELDAPVDAIRPDYYKYVDLSAYIGQTLTLTCDPDVDCGFEQTDQPSAQPFYGEKYRPQAHFSAGLGWINDPNGLVFDGERYHLFYQHNPYSHNWSNMHWGHAVSPDLLHWKELPPALSPDELGTVFSGSALMDRENRTGLKTGEQDVMLLYYTAAGNSSLRSKGRPFTQCLAYSADGGRTFQKYPGNPVVGHIEAENRDPKVVYVPELSAYVMALYLNDNRYTLLTSTDLIAWKLLQELALPGDAECPDLYPLPLDGDGSKTRWIFAGASDRYLVGEFSSGKYRPVKAVQRLHYGGNSYAAQTFSDIPATDGRRIRMAWNTTRTPHSYFCCSMCLPCEMRLQTIGREETLTAWPVREVESLFRQEENFTMQDLTAGPAVLSRRTPGAHWLEFTLTPSADCRFTLSLFGGEVEVDLPENAIRCMDKTMPVHMEDGKVRLLIIADAMGFEIFCGRGQSFMCMGFVCDYNLQNLILDVKAGRLERTDCRLAGLENIWTETERQ